MGTLDRC